MLRVELETEKGKTRTLSARVEQLREASVALVSVCTPTNGRGSASQMLTVCHLRSKSTRSNRRSTSATRFSDASLTSRRRRRICLCKWSKKRNT